MFSSRNLQVSLIALTAMITRILSLVANYENNITYSTTKLGLLNKFNVESTIMNIIHSIVNCFAINIKPILF